MGDDAIALSELQMRFTTTTDDVRIAYAVMGEGPPCVFSWGAQSSHNQLAWTIPSLRHGMSEFSRRQKVYWFDWRNTGLSSSTEEGFTIEAGVRDLDAVVSAAGPGPVALFGGASGSKAVVAYAAQHPERISRLVLWCAAVAPYAGPPNPAHKLWHDLVETDPAVALKLLARSAIGWEGDTLADWERYYTECSPLEYQSKIVRRETSFDVSGFVPRITCPVLVIQSRGIPYPTVEESAELAAHLQDAELVIVAGSSYGLVGAQEDPTPAIVEFLTRDSRSASGESARPSRLEISEVLTSREVDVLRLMAMGRSSREIAAELSLSLSTVSRHVANIYGKAGVHNRAEATMWAVRHGMA